MKFESKLFSFFTGKQSQIVTKSDTRHVQPTQPDDFVTQIVNSFPYSQFNNQRDLLLYFFNNVSEINALVTYIAQKSADIPVKHVRLLGNGKEKDISSSSSILPLLKKPNHLVNGRQFHVNAISSFFVFGYIPINKVYPIGWPVSELYVFPGNQFYPIPEKSTNLYGLPASGVDYRMNKIKQYRLFIDSQPFNFTPEEIIMINDSNLSFVNGQYLTGQSRLQSAIRSVKTLSSLYDTINTLISGKGAEGILSKISRPNEADSGWDPKDKQETLKQLYRYGLTDGKLPIAITEKDLKFLRLSVPISDFMPIQLKEHEFRSLATALGLQAVLFNDPANSKYSNVEEAEKAGYNSCIIPITNLYYEALTNGFGLNDVNEALVPDYSEIDCLQGDKKLEAETNKVWNDVFKVLWDNDMITKNQWLNELGLPEINKPEYNKVKSELEPKKPIEQESINTSTDQNTNENGGTNEPI
jgi:hypothetical protein